MKDLPYRWRLRNLSRNRVIISAHHLRAHIYTFSEKKLKNLSHCSFEGFDIQLTEDLREHLWQKTKLVSYFDRLKYAVFADSAAVWSFRREDFYTSSEDWSLSFFIFCSAFLHACLKERISGVKHLSDLGFGLKPLRGAVTFKMSIRTLFSISRCWSTFRSESEVSKDNCELSSLKSTLKSRLDRDSLTTSHGEGRFGSDRENKIGFLLIYFQIRHS